jgi:pimeloyl-ACP methyl ester carboxylesterase
LFHGTPGSRLWFDEDAPEARRLGLRVITPERPGYGLSDPAPGRTLLDWADDVRALADALAIERFSIVGVSGGGPHAAACAFTLQDRLCLTILASSSVPPHLMELRSMAWGNRIGFLLGKYASWLMRPLIAWSAGAFARDPRAALAALRSNVCPADRAVLEDPRKLEELIAHFREAYRNGTAGQEQDAALLSRAWGFDLAAIRSPVQVWHGEADTLVPVANGRALARAIPGSRLALVPGAGHLLLDIPHHWGALLETLRATAR